MTVINRPNPYALVRLQTENAPGERPGLRRFTWLVAGGALVLAALLTPALTSLDLARHHPCQRKRRPGRG